MAKFIKSIFNPSERKKSQHYEEDHEEEKSETASVGARRQLSISRSGRMRQANKKRHSLALGVYGDNIQIESSQKPSSMEYHVHAPVCKTAPPDLAGPDNRLENVNTGDKSVDLSSDVSLETKVESMDIDGKSPEEEIDSAFEIIDKTLLT